MLVLFARKDQAVEHYTCQITSMAEIIKAVITFKINKNKYLLVDTRTLIRTYSLPKVINLKIYKMKNYIEFSDFRQI